MVQDLKIVICKLRKLLKFKAASKTLTFHDKITNLANLNKYTKAWQ